MYIEKVINFKKKGRNEMRISVKFFIGVLLIAGAQQLYPEILIVKRVSNEFVPLDEKDIALHGKAINDIVLKYEWPMCIASKLTEAEQYELLAPNKPRAEEIFIQNKIQEVAGSDYYVVFIPTTLYELFCIQQIAEHYKTDTMIGRRLSEIKNDDYTYDRLNNPLVNVFERDTWNKLPNGQYDKVEVRRAVYSVYQKVNTNFYDPKESVYLALNTILAKKLFELRPGFKKSNSAEQLSDLIEKEFKELVIPLVQISSLAKIMELKLFHMRWSVGTMLVAISGLKSYRDDEYEELNKAILEGRGLWQQIVVRVIELDYESRRLNKATLFRTLRLFEAPTRYALGPTGRKVVLGNTMPFNDVCKDRIAISYGNSFFAGALNDFAACSGCILYHSRKDGIPMSSIYALLIDKKAYYENNQNDLFFIPPLAPIEALIQTHEFFHARSKSVTGFVGGGGCFSHVKYDWAGIFTAKRDPLRHAQMFSNYVAKNARIIYIPEGDMKKIGTTDEKKIMEVLSKNQEEVAKFYGEMYAMKSALAKKTERLRNRRKVSPARKPSEPVSQQESSSTSSQSSAQPIGWAEWLLNILGAR